MRDQHAAEPEALLGSRLGDETSGGLEKGVLQGTDG